MSNQELKEKYELSGIVYIFEDGNVFQDEKIAKIYETEIGQSYETVDLDKEIKSKKDKI